MSQVENGLSEKAQPGDGWFLRKPVDNAITMLAEPHVHRYFRANVWHLRGRDFDLVIDTGMGLRPLAQWIDAPAGKPLVTVATHIHVDHVGSLHEFSDRFGPRIEAEGFVTMADEATLAHFFRGIDEPVSIPPTQDWRASDYLVPPAPLTRLLDEDDIIDLGDRKLRVLHLPGHSPGSIGLLDEHDGVLFSGDAIYQGGLVDSLPGCDRELYRQTMLRLTTLPVRIVHGGHGDSFDGRRMHEIAQDYLDGRAATLDV
jgi:glyoxylase-like metal-dependent hydrolase (beta-lactamase superfamily II)